MHNSKSFNRNSFPDEVVLSEDFAIQVRELGLEKEEIWTPVVAYSTIVATANTTRNEFDVYRVAVASLSMDVRKPLELKVRYSPAVVNIATIHPASLGTLATIDDNNIRFTLNKAKDIMLKINNDKWQALHLIINEADPAEPTCDTENLWYFAPGVNNGLAYNRVFDGRLLVPSNTTIYLAQDAFLTAQVVFADVNNSGIKGPGFIFRDAPVASTYWKPRELAGGSILIERSRNILVEGVTSLRSFGYSLATMEGRDIHINRFRSFTGYGNGDGIDLFCCREVLIENCFLRNSDDTIAIYGHRWEYYGDTQNINIKNCTLLPDIAHPIEIGLHGNPEKPETFSNIKIANIDILDHCENQLWYQGCIAFTAADENLIQNILVEHVRVEKITKGQLFNIRVMQNAFYTTSPGRGIKNITLRNIELNTEKSEIIVPSQILGFNSNRRVENVTVENLKIDGAYIHNGMTKPRWYMVSDFVPLFANEHVKNLVFKLVE